MYERITLSAGQAARHLRRQLVLALHSAGCTDAQIAEILHISTRTVRRCRQALSLPAHRPQEQA